MSQKKTLVILLGLTVSINSFSQFSAGIETGLSANNAVYTGGFGLGGSIKYEAPIKQKLSLTSAIGYLAFPEKSDMTNYLAAKQSQLLVALNIIFPAHVRGFMQPQI